MHGPYRRRSARSVICEMHQVRAVARTVHHLRAQTLARPRNLLRRAGAKGRLAHFDGPTRIHSTPEPKKSFAS